MTLINMLRPKHRQWLRRLRKRLANREHMRRARDARKLCCVGVDLPLDAGTCGRMVHAESQRCIHCARRRWWLFKHALNDAEGSACLGIPTTDTDLMVRVMQGLTADAPALKAMAGISARGRKLKKPYPHIVLSWPEGTEAPPKQDMLSAVGGALKSIRLDNRHYAVCAAHTDTACPHVHVAVNRVDPETGRAVNLDAGATKRLSRWAEQYERDHGGIVVPTRVERRKAQAARRDIERRCRKGGMPREKARSTAARLHPRPPAKRAPPSRPRGPGRDRRTGGRRSPAHRSRAAPDLRPRRAGRTAAAR